MSTAVIVPQTARRQRRATPLVGVEIGAAVVRAVVVRSGAICWTGARPWATLPVDTPASETADAPLATALDALLREARAAVRESRPRWQRRVPQGVERAPAVYVALSPRLVQLKRLTGLAPTGDARQATAALRANVGQFFLANGTPLVTGGVRWVNPAGVHTPATLPTTVSHDAVAREREGWAAAYPAPVVATVVCACARARLRLRGIGPVPVVLGDALAIISQAPTRTDADASETDVPHAQWEDAGVRLALWVDPVTRQVDRVCRMPSAAPDPMSHATGAPGSWHPALEAIGPEGAAFAAAFGAACVAERSHAIDPVSLRFTRRGERTIVAARRSADATRAASTHALRPPVPRWRLALAAVACVAGLTAVAAAPGFAARRDARRAGAALRALGPRRAVATAVAADLARADDVLRQAGRDGVGKVAPLAVLAAVARVLPEGAALVDVQCDGPDGRLVALAPHAAAVLTGLARVPGLDAVEIVGPVTREPAPAAGAVASFASPNGMLGPLPLPPGLPAGPAASMPLPGIASIDPLMLERVAVRFRVRMSPAILERAVAPAR